MSAGLFDGVRVLDLGQGIAAPFCARLLGDFGAEVLKIEPLEGDPARGFAPFANDAPHHEKSLFFSLLNLNKRGVTLNLETALAREILTRLVSDSDVLVESFAPGYLEQIGLGWEEIHRTNPRLVMTSITPFGQTGPYAQYLAEEIVLYALSGVMSYSGTSDREPIKHGGFQAQYEGGLNGAAATATALLQQERRGVGEHVDLSILQCVASTAVHVQAIYSFTGAILGRRRPAAGAINTVVPCQDGYVILQVANENSWRALADILGLPELLQPPFRDPGERREHMDELNALVLTAIRNRTRKELFAAALEHRGLVGIVQSPKDLAECPHLESRGFFGTIDQPPMGTLQFPLALMSCSLTPCRLRLPAPRLGEHNHEVYSAELGYTGPQMVQMRGLGVI